MRAGMAWVAWVAGIAGIAGGVRRSPGVVVGFICLFYTVGVVGMTISWSHDIFVALVPYTLILSILLLFVFHPKLKSDEIILFSFLYFTSFAIEAVGTNTGEIFGQYYYGETLGVKVADTPLMIGINWIMMIYMGWVITAKFIKNRWLQIIPAALLLVGYDYILEPVAIATDMWSWEEAVIPLQNYLAWFLYAALAFSLLAALRIRFENKIAPALFIAQSLFFIVLNFAGTSHGFAF